MDDDTVRLAVSCALSFVLGGIGVAWWLRHSQLQSGASFSSKQASGVVASTSAAPAADGFDGASALLSMARFSIADIFAEVMDVAVMFEDPTAAQDLFCPVCLGPLQDPRQLLCDGHLEGHRVCGPCLRDMRRCPLCNLAFQRTVADRAATRALRLMHAKCPFCKNWRGPAGDLEEHCRRCVPAIARLPMLCPVTGCEFRANSEEQLREHLLRDFAGHCQLAAARPPPYACCASRDTAQIYLQDFPAFAASGECMNSPAFYAGPGYCCLLAVQYAEGDCLKVILRLCRGASNAAAPYPFALPFTVHIADPDRPAVITHYVVDFHLTKPDRETDPNISPAPGVTSWTAGIDHRFTRSAVESVNGRHLLVVLTVLTPYNAT